MTRTSFEPHSPGVAEAFRTLGRSWAATVNVVTVRRRPEFVAPGHPELDGYTATAFLLLSLEPPLLLLSATADASSYEMLTESSSLAVNLLAEDQEPLAGRFSRTAEERVDLWSQVTWSPDAWNVPLLQGTVGAFSARPQRWIEAGDHRLLIAEVTSLHVGRQDVSSLVYSQRRYGKVVPLGTPQPGVPVRASGV
jgi:flavin reductase (DIM6/NTAB) family NADH-FMN oxidoreductase RutF